MDPKLFGAVALAAARLLLGVAIFSCAFELLSVSFGSRMLATPVALLLWLAIDVAVSSRFLPKSQSFDQ